MNIVPYRHSELVVKSIASLTDLSRGMYNLKVNITFSPHALERMSLRNISEGMVHEAFENPDKEEDGRFGREVAYKKFGNKFIKVVYELDNNNYYVITVIWKSKL